MGVLGVVLGILAIGCAFLATLLFGTAGLIAAVVLALVAAVLGILKRKNDKKGGIAAIVIAVLAIVLAVALNGTWTAGFSELHKKALEYKPDGLWAKVTENNNGGLMGIISRIPGDEASINALIEEMNELNKMTNQK